MGKGGKNKIKTYKPPAEKFVVVTKAWGVDKSNPKVTCNQIGAWFEVMLSEKYPGTRPFGIYYHPKKMHYFIVELPSNVDISPFLGCHPYDSFLKGIRTSPNDVACLYEYNYKNFGNPEKTWNQGFADYARVPEGFPVRSPYPQPEPAVPPPTDLPCAIYPPRAPPIRAPPQMPINPLPEQMPPPGLDGPSTASPSTLEPSPAVLPEAPVTNTAHPMAPPDHCSRPPSPALDQEEALPSELSTFQPYEPPNHYIKPQSPSHTPTIGSPEASSCAVTPVPSSSAITPETSLKLQKWDPYEEEEAAEALLRSASLDVGSNSQDTKAFIKDEANDDLEAFEEDRDMDYRPSQDVDDGVLDFLESLVPTIKVEAQDSVPPQTHDHLSRSATIDTAMDEDEEDDYVPSAALAAAFAAMADASEAPSLSVKAEPTEHRIPHVKEEPRDVDFGSLSASSRDPTPSSMATSRSQTFSSEVSVPASSTASNFSASRSATANSGRTDVRRTPEIPASIFIKPEPVEAALPPHVTGSKRPVASLEGRAPSDASRFKKVKREF